MVVNQGSPQLVTKIQASTGTVLGTFPAPPTAYGMAFDGTYIWVSGQGALYKLLASTGSQVASYLSGGYLGLAFDGASIWVANDKQGTVSRF